MSDIFLSYASQDLERIKLLAGALAAQGWTVFYDRTIPPGKTWRQVIGKQIEQCRCMVVCWSTHAVNSHWVIEEADIGLTRKILIPLFLDPVPPPLGFGSIQGANLVDWQGNGSPDYLALCTAISEAIGVGNQPITDQEDIILNKTDPAFAPSSVLTFDQTVSGFSKSVHANALLIEPEMVPIPAGSFQMGSNMGISEQPIHTVKIAKTFSIAKYLITFDEYDLYAKANNLVLPSDNEWGRGKRPVINISWIDAIGYAAWLSEQTGKNYRLPTEAEWEYAARAATRGAYYWGQNHPMDFAWFSENSESKTHVIGQKPPNAFGLYDMAGNVFEWMQDCWHEYYHEAPNDGSAWEDKNNGNCSRRVVRGGSWDYETGYLRSAARNRSNPDLLHDNIGFRLAQD